MKFFLFKALAVTRVSIGDSIVYRFSFFIGIFLLILTLLSQFFFWNVFYDEEKSVASYDFTHLFSYLILANLSYVFMRPEGVMISEQIRQGELNVYLLKPFGFISFQFFKLLGNRIVFLFCNFFPIIVVFSLLLYFDYIFFSLKIVNVFLFIYFIAFGLLLHFF